MLLAKLEPCEMVSPKKWDAPNSDTEDAVEEVAEADEFADPLDSPNRELDSVLLEVAAQQLSARSRLSSEEYQTSPLINPNSSSPLMSEDLIPRTFCASWPSVLERFMSYWRPAADLYVIVAMIVLYSTARTKESDSEIWRFAKGHIWLFVWIPFTWRFCSGFLHWVMSLVLMPGCILYHDGPFQPYLPTSVLESIHESFVFRETYRLSLIKAGGIEVQLTTPDGVLLDVLYFRGRHATPSSPTVIRLNGNAEAFELQDELLPITYSHGGYNFMMFNYRGVGRSRWAALFGSEMLGHAWGLWRVRAISGAMLDAWTLLQFATQALRVAPDQVVLIGHSIGGGIATKLAAQRPDLPFILCNSRSFASLAAVAVRLTPHFLGVLPTSTKGKLLQWLTRALLLTSGWELNSLRHWPRVPGFKWVEYSIGDHIIPADLALRAALQAPDAVSPPPERDMSEAEEEKGLGFRCLRLATYPGLDNHNRLLFPSDDGGGEVLMHLRFVREGLRFGKLTRDEQAERGAAGRGARAARGGGGAGVTDRKSVV